MAQPVQQQFWYDEENRLVQQVDPDTGITTTYTYDGQGTLVKKEAQPVTGPSTETIYVAGIYEKETIDTAITETKYYEFNGSRVAMRKVSGDNVRSFLLGDHLGSTSTVLDSAGEEVATQKYYPYGRTRTETGTMPTDKLFTGHQQEGALYFMQARFYDPTLGRFLSAGDIGINVNNPQALNRYSYVLGNPLRYTDPTGHVEMESFQWAFDLQEAMGQPPRAPVLEALDQVGVDPPSCPQPWNCITREEDEAIYKAWLDDTMESVGVLAEAGVDIEGLPWTCQQCAVVRAMNFGCQWGAAITQVHYPYRETLYAVASFADREGIESSLLSEPPLFKAVEMLQKLRARKFAPLPGFESHGFRNKGNPLPEGGTYRTYDIYRNMPGVNRGTHRLVIDVTSGRAWYSWDHY